MVVAGAGAGLSVCYRENSWIVFLPKGKRKEKLRGERKKRMRKERNGKRLGFGVGIVLAAEQ